MTELGKINYEAYCAASNGKSLISGADLPNWDDQDEAIKTAWDAGARAVFMASAESFNQAIAGVPHLENPNPAYINKVIFDSIPQIAQALKSYKGTE